MNQFDRDLMVTVATIAHRAGVDAVDPDPDRLQMILDGAKEIGHELSKQELLRALKLAQIELLRRQLGEEA